MTVTPPRTEGLDAERGAILSCYVDAATLATLRREAEERGQSVESLAEAAIENAALEARR